MSFPSAEQTSAYRACLNEVFRQVPFLLERWCVNLAGLLYEKAVTTSIQTEKRQLLEAIGSLKTSQRELERVLLLELTKAIAEEAKPGSARKSTDGRSLSSISFDDLELMGDNQVQETLEDARLLQTLKLSCEYELAGFSARLSTVMGFAVVQADRNPLRIEVISRIFLKALRQLTTDAGSRGRWLTHGALLLGKELQGLYVALNGFLAEQGIAPAPYGVISAPEDNDRGRSPAAGAAPQQGHAGFGFDDAGNGLGAAAAAADQVKRLKIQRPAAALATGSVSREQLLTLDRLHRLMSGEYDESFKPVADIAAFDLDDFPRNEFSHTVPAAMDVLVEIQQKSLTHAALKGQPLEPPSSVALIREQLKTEAKSLGQSVAIEVVGLMIEQLTSDRRLLAPIKQIIANAEPAFLRMAISDPRFFSDKRHPARQLLEAITAKSLAYSSEEAHGFAGFMLDLQDIATLLTEEHASDAQHFTDLLADFEDKQAHRLRDAQQAQQRAVRALLVAEQRNLMAETIAIEIRSRPDFLGDSRVIKSFLTGPWAQVMAMERLASEAGQPSTVFSLTLGDILWSLNVEQTSRHRKRLVQLIPGMLDSVREGLLSINYPLADSKAFYDELMAVHQFGLQRGALAEPAADLTSAQVRNRENLARAFDAGDSQRNHPWLAPAEAQQSGFMDIDDGLDAGELTSRPDFESTRPFERHEPVERAQEADADDPAHVELQLGDWVELLADIRWLRAQLTWISPQNALFMFTSEGGRSHSMTSRVLQHLLRLQLVKVVSQHGVLDAALDSVAQAAVRNSINISGAGETQ
jgi:hypothetical protein